MSWRASRQGLPNRPGFRNCQDRNFSRCQAIFCVFLLQIWIGRIISGARRATVFAVSSFARRCHWRGGGQIVQMLLMASEVESAFDVDPVEEMRLRTWARRNYSPAEDRDGNWHPVVLDEMTQRDLENQDRPVRPR